MNKSCVDLSKETVVEFFFKVGHRRKGRQNTDSSLVLRRRKDEKDLNKKKKYMHR